MTTNQHMTTELTGTARAHFFSGYGIETLRVKVEADGPVLVWDKIAGHFTRCHALRATAQKRIARKLRAEAQGR